MVRFAEKLCTAEIERSPNGRRSEHLADLEKKRKKEKFAEAKTKDKKKNQIKEKVKNAVLKPFSLQKTRPMKSHLCHKFIQFDELFRVKMRLLS